MMMMMMMISMYSYLHCLALTPTHVYLKNHKKFSKFLSSFRMQPLVYYHKSYSLIGFATGYLFWCKEGVGWQHFLHFLTN